MNITLPAAALLFLLSLPLRAAVLLPDTAGPVLPFQADPAYPSQDSQGDAVALDGNTAVVGAPSDSSNPAGIGRVRVFNATTGAVLHHLQRPAAWSWSWAFGSQVAISGNWVVVVGGVTTNPNLAAYNLGGGTPTVAFATMTVPSDNLNPPLRISLSGSLLAVSRAGRSETAWIYDLAGATPATPRYTLTSPAPGDGFGADIAIHSGRVLVGASEAQDPGPVYGVGRAYLYNLNGATPTVPLLTVVNPAPAAQEKFGSHVAITGLRMLISAPRSLGSNGNYGEVYQYDISTPGAPILTYLNPVAGSYSFPWDMDITVQRVALGTNPSNNGIGELRIFNLNSTTPAVILPQPSLLAGRADGFAISGTRVLLGVENEGAYSYSVTSATPATPVATLFEATPPTHVEFGAEVAVAGNYVAASAPEDTRPGKSVSVYNLASATSQVPFAILAYGGQLKMDGSLLAVAASGTGTTGRVSIYDLSSATPGTPVRTLTNPAPAATATYGVSLALAGTRLAVGVQDGGGFFGGVAVQRVLLYDLAGPTPAVPVLTFTSPNETHFVETGLGYIKTFTGFGQSLALHGDRLFIAEAGSSALQSRLLVYELRSLTPAIPARILPIPVALAGNTFAVADIRSLAASGPFVFVSDVAASSGKGTGYVFDLLSATPETPRFTLQNNAPDTTNEFGRAAALSGARLAVSRRQINTTMSDVQIFDLSTAAPVPAVTLSPAAPPSFGFGGSLALDGSTLVVGSPNDSTFVGDQGAVHVFRPAAQVSEVSLRVQDRWHIPGQSQDLGPQVALAVNAGAPLEIVNTGSTQLSITAINFTGTHAADFSISPNSAVNLTAGARRSHTLTVRPGAAGTRTANLRIVSNDPARLTYLIPITVTALSTTTDTDGDGLSDAAEYSLAGLGFNYQISQPALVAAYTAGANTAGYYTQSQIEALNVSTPLIARDPATGNFTLTLDLRRSTNLTTFTDLPLTAGQTSVSGGDVRLSFPLPGNVNFLRVQTGP